MRVHYSEAWGGWQAQAIVNGELITVISKVSRERVIKSLLEIIFNEKQAI